MDFTSAKMSIRKKKSGEPIKRSPISLFKETDAISVSIYHRAPSNYLVDFSNLFTNMESTRDLPTGGTMP